METTKLKPRSVGENLDKTFSLAKTHFKSYFIILLLLMGPGFLINYIFLFLGGANVIKGTTEGGFFASLDNDTQATGVQQFVLENLGSGMELLFVVLTGLASFILIPMAHASVLIGTTKGMKNESWTVSEVIKGAFSRFWPLIGSSLLFGVIVTISLTAGLLFVVFAGFGTASGGSAVGAIILGVMFLLAVVALAIFFTIKLGFFFASVTFEKVAPGFSKSWKLTKGRFWPTFGFFAVVIIINICISFLLEGIASFALGTSVLSTVLMNLSSIITTLFLMVGYAVYYTDLRTRNEASNIRDMISSYKSDDEAVPSSTDR
ncbi:hypothetical protein H0266_08705 [Halobacillus locisalis]|uniref:Membrane domain of glycerophosphoryl diester phosphodiesterase n=1 Tax=Halobacillus locisalis TaxID=220753 RepID=A0A838CSH5_9BACI|nr:hypothetical protein [Halobacillus locisalis]MBA2174970.1 hypothetical protein [Halobacillus locisalis]